MNRCSTGIWGYIIPAVTASKLVTTRLGAVSGTVSNGATVDTFHLDSFNQGSLFLAAAGDMSHFFDFPVPS